MKKPTVLQLLTANRLVLFYHAFLYLSIVLIKYIRKLDIDQIINLIDYGLV